MSFTLEQNVTGAAAFEEATVSSADINSASITGFASGLFGVAEEYGRTQLATARANAPTAGEKEDALFANLLKKAVEEAKGKTGLAKSTALNSMYSEELTKTGFVPNERQMAALASVTGHDFGAPAAPTEVDLASEAFAKDPLALGYIAQAKEAALASGAELSDSEAYQEGMERFASVTATAQAYQVNRLTRWNTATRETGLQVLDDVTQAAWSAVQVEMQGGNINPEIWMRLETFLLQTEGQFAKPVGVSDEEYAPFVKKFENIRNAIAKGKEWDREALSLTGTQALTGILADAPSPLYSLLLENPALQQQLSFDTQADLAKLIERYNETGITYTTPEFTPEMFAALGLTGEGNVIRPAAVLIHTPEDTQAVQLLLEGAQDKQGQKDINTFIEMGNLELNRGTVASIDTDAGAATFAAGAGKLSLLLSEMGTYAGTEMIEKLYSQDTMSKLRRLKQVNPELGTLVEEQLGAAIQAQSALLTLAETPRFKNSPFKVVGDTGELMFNKEDTAGFNKDTMGRLEEVALVHYNGSLEALFNDASRAARKAGREYQDLFMSNEYGQIVQAFSRVKSIPKQRRRISSLLKTFNRFDEPVSPAGGATAVPTGDLGSSGNPYPIYWSDTTDTDEKAFDALSDGAYYIGRNGETFQKGGITQKELEPAQTEAELSRKSVRESGIFGEGTQEKPYVIEEGKELEEDFIPYFNSLPMGSWVLYNGRTLQKSKNIPTGGR